MLVLSNGGPPKIHIRFQRVSRIPERHYQRSAEWREHVRDSTHGRWQIAAIPVSGHLYGEAYDCGLAFDFADERPVQLSEFQKY